MTRRPFPRALRAVDTTTGECLYTQPDGKMGTLRVTPETATRLHAWLHDPSGPLLQDAVPELSADERELCLSGIHPDEWDAMFAKAPRY